MGEGDTLINAVIGGVVGIVLSFVPFSPLLGGGVAANLQGGDRDGGVRVGLLAGAMMIVPLVLLTYLIGNVYAWLILRGMAPDVGGTFGLVGGLTPAAFVFSLVAGLTYVIGLASVGGFLGNYLKQDIDL